MSRKKSKNLYFTVFFDRCAHITETFFFLELHVTVLPCCLVESLVQKGYCLQGYTAAISFSVSSDKSDNEAFLVFYIKNHGYADFVSYLPTILNT
jgi:hypothetical protein